MGKTNVNVSEIFTGVTLDWQKETWYLKTMETYGYGLSWCGGETSPRLFSGKLKLIISLDQ